MARKKNNRNNKGKIAVAVIIEIVIMATEILCCLLPMPWRLVVPIVIGARAIISKAIRYVKTPSATPIVYCNGNNKPTHAGKK